MKRFGDCQTWRQWNISIGKNMLEQNTVHRNKANPMKPSCSLKTGMRVFMYYLHTILLYQWDFKPAHRPLPASVSTMRDPLSTWRP